MQFPAVPVSERLEVMKNDNNNNNKNNNSKTNFEFQKPNSINDARGLKYFENFARNMAE